MKNIFKISTIILTAAVLASGCIKETFPKGSTVTKEQLEQSDNALNYMLSGIPAAMMNSGTAGFAGTYGFHGDFGISAIHLATESMLEDIAILGELGYYWFASYYQNTSQGSDYIWCAFFWNQYYKWIKLANEIINVVGEVTEDTSESAKSALGQAYTYRAMYYLDLARLYEYKPNNILATDQSLLGLTVPIVKEDTDEEKAKNNARATREELYTFIIQDLKKAEEYLKDGLNSYTAPGIAAVYGLYARLYLELGATYADPEQASTYEIPATWTLTSSEAYEKAAYYARKVIDMKLHTPLTQAQWEDPKSGFNDGTSNKSWIWGLTVSAENLSNLIANIAHRSCEALYGYAVWTQLGVNQALYNQINDDDFRKHSWYDPDLNYAYQFAGSADEQKGFVNGSMYNYPAVKYESLKFRPADGNVMDYTVGNCADWPLMRIEEMYFIEMEAQLNLDGGLEKARELLNEFMQEYRYAEYDCSTMTLSKPAFIKEMMLQKRIEFWGEGILFFDYKRLDMGITRGYSGTNVPATATFNCEGRSPQWNIVISRLEFQSNQVIKGQNNPDPTEKLVLWK